MLLPPYTTGTVTVAVDGLTVSGTATVWTDLNAREGDWLRDPATGYTTVITGRGDATHLTVPAWKGAPIVSGAYEIYPYSPLRFSTGQAVADLTKMLGIINGATVFYIVAGTAPDDSLGEEGQFAIKINATPWQQWLKTGGAWVLLGTPVGLNGRGAWSNIATYAVNDWVTASGSAYIASAPSTGQAPPNASYWTLLGAKGDKGDTGNAATIAVGTVTTGAAGSAAVVTNAGSSGAAVFNFTIPKGDKGDQGNQGNQGIQGPAPTIVGTSTSLVAVSSGAKNFSTQAGIAWSVGQRLRAANAAGDRVVVGLVGSYNGATGALVLNVDTVQGVGSDNTWTITVAGEQGQQGSVGPGGPVGPVGPQGTKGDTGAASTVPGPQGPQGQGLSWNASGTLAQRSTYDGQTQGFAFLQTDVSPFLLWVKASNTSADWAGPMPTGGNIPIGDLGHASDTLTQNFDLGHAA